MDSVTRAAKLIYDRTSAVAPTIPFERLDPESHEAYRDLAREVTQLVTVNDTAVVS